MAKNKTASEWTPTELFNTEVKQVDTTLLEQYKLYVETANATSATRIQANTFFLTINTTLVSFVVGVVEFSNQEQVPIWIVSVCVAGLFLCVAWYLLLGAYRNLNSARYQIIQKLETRLPANIYAREWEIALKKWPKHKYVQRTFIKKDRPNRKYIRQTLIEQAVPVGFALLYISLTVVLILTSI